MISDAAKKVIWDFLVKQAIAKAIASLPRIVGVIFNIPIIGDWILSFILKFTDQLFQLGKKFLNFKAIDFEKKEDREFFDSVIAEFETVTNNPEREPTPEEIAAARKKVSDALGKLVSLRPRP